MLQDTNANHEVTIVMFSRSFYPDATSLEEFPEETKHSILVDGLGRFYQDFYRY